MKPHWLQWRLWCCAARKYYATGLRNILLFIPANWNVYSAKQNSLASVEIWLGLQVVVGERRNKIQHRAALLEDLPTAADGKKRESLFLPGCMGSVSFLGNQQLSRWDRSHSFLLCLFVVDDTSWACDSCHPGIRSGVQEELVPGQMLGKNNWLTVLLHGLLGELLQTLCHCWVTMNQVYGSVFIIWNAFALPWLGWCW